MTGGKNLVKELRPNINHITVSFGDNSKSEVLGFGKVVVAHNITLVDVMLVKTLGYNLLSVSALGKMGFAVFIDNDIVVLLWSKTLKVAFVGYREHNLYVVDFSGETTSSVPIRKGGRGLVVASPLGPCQHENFAKSSQG